MLITMDRYDLGKCIDLVLLLCYWLLIGYDLIINAPSVTFLESMVHGGN